MESLTDRPTAVRTLRTLSPIQDSPLRSFLSCFLATRKIRATVTPLTSTESEYVSTRPPLIVITQLKLNDFFFIFLLQYVVNVTPNLPNVFEDSGTIQYLQIPITDHWSQNLANFFPAAIHFIGNLRIHAHKHTHTHTIQQTTYVEGTCASLSDGCNLNPPPLSFLFSFCWPKMSTPSRVLRPIVFSTSIMDDWAFAQHLIPPFHLRRVS